ncbi:hypothetical protein ACVILL_005479 [Bradyrhizobium sp. USDA 3364]
MSGSAYLNAELTALNWPLTLVPMPLTPATITMLMPPAMIAYSMAVAPTSSRRNLASNARMKSSCPTLAAFSPAP